MGPGERAFVHAGGTQFFELLSEPNAHRVRTFQSTPSGKPFGSPVLRASGSSSFALTASAA